MDLNPSRRPLTSIFIPEWLYNSYINYQLRLCYCSNAYTGIGSEKTATLHPDFTDTSGLRIGSSSLSSQDASSSPSCCSPSGKISTAICVRISSSARTHVSLKPTQTSQALGYVVSAKVVATRLLPPQVRIATYIQAFSGTLLLGFSSHDTSGVRTTIVITSLALVGTSIILNIENTLSLNHAMVVYDLLTMTILPMHFVEPWRVRSPGLYAAQQCRFLLWCALSFWLWTKTPCLGNTPECNQCTRTTSFFFWTAHACRNLNRSFHIFSVLLVLIIWLRSHTWTYGPQNYVLTLPALVLEQHAQRWTDYVRKNEEALQIWRRRRIRSMKNPIVIVTKFYHWYDDETTIAQGIKERRWMRTATSWAQRRTRLSLIWSDARLAVRVPRAQRMLIALVFVTFYTYATERIITMNLTKDANTWGYGQTASLILTVPAVGTLARLALSLWKRSR